MRGAPVRLDVPAFFRARCARLAIACAAKRFASMRSGSRGGRRPCSEPQQPRCHSAAELVEGRSVAVRTGAPPTSWPELCRPRRATVAMTASESPLWRYLCSVRATGGSCSIIVYVRSGEGQFNGGPAADQMKWRLAPRAGLARARVAKSTQYTHQVRAAESGRDETAARSAVRTERRTRREPDHSAADVWRTLRRR